MATDAALGALLGAAVGDAAGAPLEFIGRISPEQADAALLMPGGGVLGVGPGQFTDDTELALSLANGLVGHDPRAGFPTDAVAQQYHAWLESVPFDVGRTCGAAFGEGPAAAAMQAAAAERSGGSKANGALMRASPLAIWGHALGDGALAACAAADARLSHPNPTCQDCNAAYVLALAHLIRRPGDAAGAMARAEAWAAAHACEEVLCWLEDSKAEDISSVVDATQNIGFAKHAFTLAFHHLRQRSGFAEGLRAALLAGGDTDTNACIVAAVLGALWGAAAIPATLSGPVLSYAYPADGEWKGYSRPAALQGHRIPGLAKALCELGAGAVAQDGG